MLPVQGHGSNSNWATGVVLCHMQNNYYCVHKMQACRDGHVTLLPCHNKRGGMYIHIWHKQCVTAQLCQHFSNQFRLDKSDGCFAYRLESLLCQLAQFMVYISDAHYTYSGGNKYVSEAVDLPRLV